MKKVIIYDNTCSKSLVKKNAQLKKTPLAVVVSVNDKEHMKKELKGSNEGFNFVEGLDERHLKGDKVSEPKKETKKKTEKKSEKKPSVKKTTSKKKK